MELSQALMLWCVRCRESWQRLRHNLLYSYLLKITVPCSTRSIVHYPQTAKCASESKMKEVERKQERCSCNTDKSSTLILANTACRANQVSLPCCLNEHAARLHECATFLRYMRFTALTHSIRTFCVAPVLHGMRQANSKENNFTTINTTKISSMRVATEPSEMSNSSRVNNNDDDDTNKSYNLKDSNEELSSEKEYQQVNDDCDECVDLFSEEDLIRLHNVHKSNAANVDCNKEHNSIDEDEHYGDTNREHSDNSKKQKLHNMCEKDAQVDEVNIEIEQMNDASQIQHTNNGRNSNNNDENHSSAVLENKEHRNNANVLDDQRHSSLSSSFSSGAGSSSGVVEEVTELDSFARAKVTNFVQHLISSGQVSCKDVFAHQSTNEIINTCSNNNNNNSNSSINTNDNFTLHINVREVESGSGNSKHGDRNENILPTQFHARFHLPLPECYGERYAEGFAHSSKDAELVAAMHAIRVINTLGLPLFQLSSRQRRHAQAERAAGRWAPMPHDVPRPPSTPSPVPLQLINAFTLHSTINSNSYTTSNTTTTTNNNNMNNSCKGRTSPSSLSSSSLLSFKGWPNEKIKHNLFSSEQLSAMNIKGQFAQQSRWETRGIHFIQVQHGACSPLLCTLPSPYFFDHGAHARIRAFFSTYKRNLRTTVYIAPLHKIQKKRERWLEKSKRDSAKLLQSDRNATINKNKNNISIENGVNSQNKKVFRIADFYPHRQVRQNYYAGSRSGKKRNSKKWNRRNGNSNNNGDDDDDDDESNGVKNNSNDKDDEEEDELDGEEGGNSAKGDNGEHYESYDVKPTYLSRIPLPLPQRFGFREAIGKAPTAYESTVLACMHAELIIDTVGLALFPESKEKQAIHAEECRRVGRWCAEPLSSEYRYKAPSPPALELSSSLDPALQLTLNENEINTSHTVASATSSANSDKQNFDADKVICSEKNNATMQTAQTSPLSLNNVIESESGTSGEVIASAEVRRGGQYDCFESLLIEHSKAIREYTHTIDVPRAEHGARILFRAYMQQFEPVDEHEGIHNSNSINNTDDDDTNKEEKEDAVSKKNSAHINISSSSHNRGSKSTKRNIYQTSNKYYSFYTEKIGFKCKEVVRASITVPLVATDVVKEMIRIEHARLAEHEQHNKDENNSNNSSDNTNTDEHTCNKEMKENGNAEVKIMSKQEEEEEKSVPLLKVDSVQITDPNVSIAARKEEVKIKSNTVLPRGITNVQECVPRESETFVALGIGKTEIEAQTLAAMYALTVLDRLNRLHGPFVEQHRNLRKEVAWWFKSTLPSHKRMKMTNTNGGIEGKDNLTITTISSRTDNNENVNNNCSEIEMNDEVLLPSALQTYREGELTCLTTSSTSSSSSSPDTNPNNEKINHINGNTSSRCWPPVLRCIGHHINRVVVPGIRTEELHAQKARWNRYAPTSMCRNVTDLYAKDDYVLSSLHENRSKLHRDVWSIESDYVNRILISPFAKPEDSRNYVHTLPGVRSPDLFAVNRLKDYLERHGKSVESAVVTRGVRERVTLRRKNVSTINGKNSLTSSSTNYKAKEYEDDEENMSNYEKEEEEDENDDEEEDDDNEEEEEEENENSVDNSEFYTKDIRLYVVRALLPLPAHIHVINEELLENSTHIANSCSLNNINNNNNNNNNNINETSNETMEKEESSKKECTNNDIDSEDDFTHVPGTCVAQGEAYDALTALTMCAMHAELLLDALGLPLYDHPVLQRKHSDTARTLGRWAPLSIHGNRPPLSLGPVKIPPPLRKPLARSTIWLSYMQERKNKNEKQQQQEEEEEVKNRKSHDEEELEQEIDTEKENVLSSSINTNTSKEEESDQTNTMTKTTSIKKEECNAQTQYMEMQQDQTEIINETKNDKINVANNAAAAAAIDSAFGVEDVNTITRENVKETPDVEINVTKDNSDVNADIDTKEDHNMEKCKTNETTNIVVNNNKEDDVNSQEDEDEVDVEDEEEQKEEDENDDKDNEESAERATMPTDDELCNISKLRPIHPTEVFLNAAKHISYFFRCRGIEFSRVIRQYTVDEPPYGRVHRSIVTLPLPDKFGVRNAVGVASNKRRSYVLCAMHATQILDSLNIAIYTGRKQDMYARLGELKGRPAPRQHVPIKEAATPSPNGLVCLDNFSLLSKPSIPQIPSISKIVHDNREWEFYIRRCNGYIQQAETIKHTHSMTTLKQAYRRGIEVEDNVLLQVENRELDRFSLNRLKTLTMRTRLPEPGEFNVTGFNNPPNRVYLAVTDVVGTPYEARGWGKAHKESVNRAAMMYEIIIQTIVVQNTPRQFAHLLTAPFLPLRWRSNAHNNSFHGNNSSTNKTHRTTNHNSTTTASNKNSHTTNAMYTSLSALATFGSGHGVLLDMTKHELNSHGKMLALALFASTTPPFEALRITRRDRKLPFAPSSSSTSSRKSKSESASHVMTIRVEMSSEDGLRKVGKGESMITTTHNNNENSINKALTLAIQDLYTQLQRRNQFQALCRTLQFHFSNVQVNMLGLPHDRNKVQLAFEHLHSTITHLQTNCSTDKGANSKTLSELSTCSHKAEETQIKKQLCLLDLWSDEGFFSTAETQLLLHLTESVIEASSNSQLSSEQQQEEEKKKITTTSGDFMLKSNTLPTTYTVNDRHSKYSTLMEMGLVEYVTSSDTTSHDNHTSENSSSSSSFSLMVARNYNSHNSNLVLHPTLHGILVSFFVQCIPPPQSSSSSSVSRFSSHDNLCLNFNVERGAMLPLQLAKLLLAGLLWHIAQETVELVACLLHVNQCASLWQLYIYLNNQISGVCDNENEKVIGASYSVDIVSFMCNCLYHNTTTTASSGNKCKHDSLAEHLKKNTSKLQCKSEDEEQISKQEQEQSKEEKYYEEQMEQFRNEVKKTASVILSRMRLFRANCTRHHVTALDKLLSELEENKVQKQLENINETTRRARLLQALTFATFPSCMYVNPVATIMQPKSQVTHPAISNKHNNEKEKEENNKQMVFKNKDKVFIHAPLTSVYSEYKTSIDASNNNNNETSVRNARSESMNSVLPVEQNTCSVHKLLDECETGKVMSSQQYQERSVKSEGNNYNNNKNNNKQLFCAPSSVFAHFDLHLQDGSKTCTHDNNNISNNSRHTKIYIGALVSPVASVLATSPFTSDMVMAVSEEIPLIVFLYKGTVAIPFQRSTDIITLRTLQREVESTMHKRLGALPDKVQVALDELLLVLTDQYVYSPLDNCLSCNGVKL